MTQNVEGGITYYWGKPKPEVDCFLRRLKAVTVTKYVQGSLEFFPARRLKDRRNLKTINLVANRILNPELSSNTFRVPSRQNNNLSVIRLQPTMQIAM